MIIFPVKNKSINYLKYIFFFYFIHLLLKSKLIGFVIKQILLQHNIR